MTQVPPVGPASGHYHPVFEHLKFRHNSRGTNTEHSSSAIKDPSKMLLEYKGTEFRSLRCVEHC